MALLLKGGAIFLHIPKTGGRWVTQVLEASGLVVSRLGPIHADAACVLSPSGGSGFNLLSFLLKRRLGLLPRKNPYMFCFVRHPLRWYESFFNYNCEPDVNWRFEGDVDRADKWHPNAPLNGLGNPDFNVFVSNVIRRYPGYVTEMYSRFATPQVSFVGRQEQLCEDLIGVLKLLRLPFDEQFIRNYREVGVSPKRATECDWDPVLKAEVTRLEYAGLVRWGYAARDPVEDPVKDPSDIRESLPQNIRGLTPDESQHKGTT